MRINTYFLTQWGELRRFWDQRCSPSSNSFLHQPNILPYNPAHPPYVWWFNSWITKSEQWLHPLYSQGLLLKAMKAAQLLVSQLFLADHLLTTTTCSAILDEGLDSLSSQWVYPRSSWIEAPVNVNLKAQRKTCGLNYDSMRLAWFAAILSVLILSNSERVLFAILEGTLYFAGASLALITPKWRTTIASCRSRAL